MKILEGRLPHRRGNRLAGSAIAIVTVIMFLAVLAIGKRTSGAFTGGGADMAHHYMLVYWFSQHRSMPTAHDVGAMAQYPPASHLAASLIGRVVGSPFHGMQLLAIVAVVMTWAAIAALLATLPGRRRWVALAALAGLLALNTSIGPLRLHLHGFEIIVNFFFAQLAGQALVWWLAWFAVRRRVAGRSSTSTALTIGVAAVLSTFVHVLPAVQMLVLVGCLSAVELLERWRSGRRTRTALAMPILVPATTAVAIILTPGFRAMRQLSEIDGALDVPYLSGLSAYVGVAVAVAAVSSMLLLLSASRRDEPSTAAVLQGLGFVGFAVAVPCVLQALLLAGGEGSPYAVKKYIYGLLSVLVVDACAALAVLVPGSALERVRPRVPLRWAGPVALAILAALALFSHTGSNYSLPEVKALEEHVPAVADADGVGTDRHGYAVALPRSDPVLDYMFSIAMLAAPPDQAVEELLRPRLEGDSLRPRRASGGLVTAAGSPYDSSACRRFGPRDGLVAVDAACWWRTATRCEAVNVLGQRGHVDDPRLRGFWAAEPTGRWTDGRRASFSCVVAANQRERPLAIELEATAFVPASVRRQRVTLAVGAARKHFVFTPQRPHAVLRVPVPRPMPRRLTVTLTLPDAISPQAAGLAADLRELGIFITEIRIG